jgi:competence protein ComEA
MTNESPETGSRSTLILFTLLILAIIAGTALLLATRPAPVTITINPPPPTATALPSATPAPITVYVTGAVAQPGTTVTLPPGSRVEDALAAAGGILPSADMERVNLAALLRDGDQVHVPAVGDADAAIATASGGTLININTATADEIDQLPGIGPALAERIVAYRETTGPFASLDDLDQVEGIGPDVLADIGALIVFE